MILKSIKWFLHLVYIFNFISTTRIFWIRSSYTVIWFIWSTSSRLISYDFTWFVFVTNFWSNLRFVLFFLESFNRCFIILSAMFVFFMTTFLSRTCISITFVRWSKSRSAWFILPMCRKRQFLIILIRTFLFLFSTWRDETSASGRSRLRRMWVMFTSW